MNPALPIAPHPRNTLDPTDRNHGPRRRNTLDRNRAQHPHHPRNTAWSRDRKGADGLPRTTSEQPE